MDNHQKDWINESLCKNCISFNKKKNWCSERNEKTYDEGHCSFFTLRKEKNKEVKESIPEVFKNIYLKRATEYIKQIPLYYDENQSWWQWNHESSRWGIIDEIDLMNTHDKIISMDDSVASGRKNAIIESLKRVARKNKPKEIPNFWIQFNNTIVDLKTGRTFSASSEYFTVNPIPWNLGSNDSTPKIDKLLCDWVGQDYVITVKEIIAYCMIPNYPINRIFCFNGGGCNGKSTLLRMIKKIIGDSNVVSTELETLLTSRFEPAKLYKKLVCQLGETNFDKLTKTSLLKKLVGQDLIGGEFKNKPPFDFVNYAKIIIATNSLPQSDDRTHGFYRRWLIVDFPNSFPKEKEILDSIPDEEYNNFCKQCVSILRGALLSNGCFTNEGNVVLRQKRYEERSDPLQAFIEEHCIEGHLCEVLFTTFYTKFSSYLKSNGFRSLSSKKVSMMLSEKNFDRQKKGVRNDGDSWTTQHFIIGLRLKDQVFDYSKKYEESGVVG